MKRRIPEKAPAPIPGSWYNPLFWFLMLILVTGSCRKAEVTYTPVNDDPADNLNVFTNQSLSMVSYYESSNNKAFSPFLCYQLGSNIQSDDVPDGAAVMIFKTLSAVHTYNRQEAEYHALKNGITALQDQVTELSNQITELGQELSLDVSKLNEYMGDLAKNVYVGYLMEVLDSTSSAGLTYFPKTAAMYKNQGLDASSPQVQTLKTKAVNYALTVHPDVGAPPIQYDMKNIVNQLHLLIVPPSTPNTNVVMNYAVATVNALRGQGFSDEKSMKLLYLLLENYFISLVNYQFQATNVYTNACGLVDSTGTDAKNWYTESFSTMIKKEVAVFIQCVNYLVVNSYEYRLQNKFVSDLPFANSGLSENTVIINPMARAQFVANMLYLALGLQAPVIAGSIITPAKYSDGDGNYVNMVLLTAQAPTAGLLKEYAVSPDYRSGPNGVPSQIPNTYWENGSPVKCHPDNHWNVYNIGQLGVTDTAWNVLQPSQPVQITMRSSGNRNPWPHYKAIDGTVALQWYNPRDPSQVSPVRTATCTMHFGYFCGTWGWGFPYISHADLGHMQRTPNFSINNFNKTFQGYYIYQTVPPFMATSDYGGNLYVHSHDGFSFDYNALAGMHYSATAVATSHYYLIGDLWYKDMATGPEKPSIGGGIQGWGAFSASYSMGGSNNDMNILMGTGLDRFNFGGGGHSQDYTYWAQGGIVDSRVHNIPGRNFSGFGVSGNLNTSSTYQPCISYYYQTFNIGNPHASINIYPMQTFVYKGTFPVPTP